VFAQQQKILRFLRFVVLPEMATRLDMAGNPPQG
jgi:hypothetical protein